MPVPDLVRESFLGQFVYYISGRRWLQYAEERPDFVLPMRYQKAQQIRDNEKSSSSTPARHTRPGRDRPPPRLSTSSNASAAQRTSTPRRSEAATLVDADHEHNRPPQPSDTEAAAPPIGGDPADGPVPGNDAEKQKVGASKEEEREKWDDQDWLQMVDWYGPDDPEHPMNVSF
jgi:MFS transporter, DHA1 family, multidrug resistance protein